LSDNLIYSRIDEVIGKDKECTRLMGISAEVSREFLNSLTGEQRKRFLIVEARIYESFNQCLYTLAKQS
jgi:hypothetical protein